MTYDEFKKIAQQTNLWPGGHTIPVSQPKKEEPQSDAKKPSAKGPKKSQQKKEQPKKTKSETPPKQAPKVDSSKKTDTDVPWLARNRDWMIGTGAGALAGTAAYSLTDMIPALKRQRVLRFILGAGTGLSVGLGVGALVPVEKGA